MTTRAKNWILRPYLNSAHWIEKESTIVVTDTFCVLTSVIFALLTTNMKSKEFWYVTLWFCRQVPNFWQTGSFHLQGRKLGSSHTGCYLRFVVDRLIIRLPFVSHGTSIAEDNIIQIFSWQANMVGWWFSILCRLACGHHQGRQKSHRLLKCFTNLCLLLGWRCSPLTSWT